MEVASIAAGKARAEINVAPLIDVMLVLLIAFMVIAPSLSYGLPTLAPQPPDGKAASPAVPLILTVQADGGVRLNRELVADKELGARLVEIFKNAHGQPVFVEGEKDSDFGQVGKVIDIAKGAGIDRVALLTRRLLPDQPRWVR